jgi:phospholipase A1/A2
MRTMFHGAEVPPIQDEAGQMNMEVIEQRRTAISARVSRSRGSAPTRPRAVGARSWIAILCLASAAPLAAQDDVARSACREAFLEDQVDTYEPIYFVVGHDSVDGFNAKFQMSVDLEIFCKEGKVAKNPSLRRLRQVHFSFSQTSIWDLSELSSPFRDSSYRPRLFYRLGGNGAELTGSIRELDIGFAHESNGKALQDSRSIDMLFVRPTFSFPLDESRERELSVQPMIYAYTGTSSNNSDVADYRGYVDLHIEYLWGPRGSNGARTLDPWAAWIDLRKGNRSNFGSIEASLAVPYRMLPLIDNFKGWLMLQYFNGYGENLLEYNQKLDSQLRLGFCIII